MIWQAILPRPEFAEHASSLIREKEAKSVPQPPTERSEGLSLIVYPPNERMSFTPLNIRKRKFHSTSPTNGDAPRKHRVIRQNDGRKRLEPLNLFSANPFPPNQNDFVLGPQPRFERPESGEINSLIKLKRPSHGPGAKKDGDSAKSPKSPSKVLANPERAFRSGNAPINLQMLSNNVEYLSRMNSWERGVWTFFWNNFCPGRSVLVESNPWYDFARLVDDSGVKCAILSLISIFVHDYRPEDSLRYGSARYYDIATHNLSSLLAMGEELVDNFDRDIAITMLIVFSIRDALLLEDPQDFGVEPRWSRGFKLALALLDETDSAKSRFWKNANHPSSLRISQSILVGRATILPQMMTKLPETDNWDPFVESRRFQWLLDGREKDIYKIHGACGFSRRVLHAISQVTFVTTALKQHDENSFFPTTAEYIRNQLRDAQQWCCDWNGDGTIWQSVPRPAMAWVKAKPTTSILTTAVEVAQVTAEAWRLLGVIYAECRAIRLPRDHPEVIQYLDELATCVKLLPTSGSLFTAQTPFFPVFLLGVLATLPEHRQTSKEWFEKVMKMQVRSTIPPIHGLLELIWERNDLTLVSSLPQEELPKNITDRHPWWEEFVEEITKTARGFGVFDVTAFW